MQYVSINPPFYVRSKDDEYASAVIGYVYEDGEVTEYITEHGSVPEGVALFPFSDLPRRLRATVVTR